MLRARFDILKLRLTGQRTLTNAARYAIASHRMPTVAHLGRNPFLLARLHRGAHTNSVENDKPPGATSYAEPLRPDLYYHLVGPPTPLSTAQPVFALSFLPTSPRTADSCAVIGWVPATHNQQSRQASRGASYSDFKENRKFRDFLHMAIQDGLKEGVDEIQVNSAIQLQNGWLHIYDERNIPPLGRVGDPNDIIASVLVEDGKILGETYQPMPAYRLCTTDGITKLTPGLAMALQSSLKRKTIDA